MIELPGRPSDAVQPILATGRAGISSLFLSLSARHPEGDDAGYLAWHTLDHRPEQYRLPQIRAAIRVISTPACRNARAASAPGFDPVDHVMAYFFTNETGMPGFNDLAVALKQAGRMEFSLPSVMSGTFAVEDSLAAPQIKAGADVLPWWPATGVYMIVSRAPLPLAELIEVEGVAGVWSAHATHFLNPAGFAPDVAPGCVAYCFLHDDPVLVAGRMQATIGRLAAKNDQAIALAAPFHMLVPHEWHRHLH